MLTNKDDDLLLQNIISLTATDKEGIMVELVIRPECNQKCKYCYIVQHGCESYPNRANNSTILNNLDLLMDEFIEKNYKIKSLELFAGDLFYDDLFFEIMPIIKKYYQHLAKNHPDFIQQCHSDLMFAGDYRDPSILIPCNMSFCTDKEKIQKVKNICHEFDTELGIRIFFSYSTDGIYALDSREQKELNESYFDTIFALCEEMGWGIHPMISYEGIDNAIDNYNWFKVKMKQYALNYNCPFPSYLEVRNDGWSPEALEKFGEFIKYYLSDLFHNVFYSDIKLFFNKFFSTFERNKDGKFIVSPGFVGLGKFSMVNSSRMPCSIGSYSMCINVGDLSLLPCHRLAYPELRGGKYHINENNKITELKATEYLSSYLSIYHYNNFYPQRCLNCKYNLVCLKGCLGAQYEKYGDISITIPNVCEMFEVKYNTMIEFYHSIGMFHYMFKYEPDYPYNTIFQDLLIKLNYNEYKMYKNLGDFKNAR